MDAEMFQEIQKWCRELSRNGRYDSVRREAKGWALIDLKKLESLGYGYDKQELLFDGLKSFLTDLARNYYGTGAGQEGIIARSFLWKIENKKGFVE